MLSEREQRLIASLADRHQRRKQPYFVADGLRVCREAVMRRPEWARLLVLTEAFADSPQGRAFLELPPVGRLRREVVPSAVFARLVETESPQGVACLLERPAPREATELPQPFTLILDRVAEPGNLGTILRSAWAVGLRRLWLVRGGADPFAPKVVRAGMGAQFALDFAWFNSLADARERLLHLGGQRLWCTEETADISVFDERRFDLRNAGLVIGNEANGISDTTLGTPVTIPMPGHAESLNVAQATTVFLFEAVRRGLL